MMDNKDIVYMWGEPYDLNRTPKFKVGDRVRKPKGYAFDSIVIGVF